MPATVHTRRAFRVVFSSVWFPATVVIAHSSISGFPCARRIAIASSCPGSQSRMILLGIVLASPRPAYTTRRSDAEMLGTWSGETRVLEAHDGPPILPVRAACFAWIRRRMVSRHAPRAGGEIRERSDTGRKASLTRLAVGERVEQREEWTWTTAALVGSSRMSAARPDP